ncbi:MAG TPA: hypothetical protein VGM83_14860 [Devosiaceae bacterium]|jgi:hypothetical protein
MRYLGRFSGSGMLQSNGDQIAPASYDFDRFLQSKSRIIGSGEIRLSASALRGVFGRTDLQLMTDDGHLLALRFSEKELQAEREFAHVDVTGDLPTAHH